MSRRRKLESREEAERVLTWLIENNDPHWSMPSTIETTPDDADPDLVARAMLMLLPKRAGELLGIRVPVAALRAFQPRITLDGIDGTDDDLLFRTHIAIILRDGLDVTESDDVLTHQWLQALLTYRAIAGGFTDKQGRATIAAAAADPSSVRSVRGLVAAGLKPMLTFLAILAADGSPDSLAILESKVTDAIERDDSSELLALAKLRAIASTSAAQILDRVDRVLACKRSVWTMIGWFGDSDESLSFSVLLKSHPAGHSVLVNMSSEMFMVALMADDRQRGTITRRIDESRTDFLVERDDFSLGECLPTQLPEFLQRAAARLGIEWDFKAMQVQAETRTRALTTWLRSGRPPSRKSGIDSRYYR